MQSWVWEFYESGPHLRRSPKKWSAIAEGLRNTAIENSSINVQSQKSSKCTSLPAQSFCEVKPTHWNLIWWDAALDTIKDMMKLSTVYFREQVE
jgi:hypothetical protein